MKKIRGAVGCAMGTMVLLGRVSAAILAGWDVEEVVVSAGTGLETNAPLYTFYSTTSEVTQVTAHLSLGRGVNPSTTAGQYGFKISSSEQTNSLGGAIHFEHYIECSVIVENGYRINLESIELNGQASAGGCSNVVLMSSIDGFIPGQELASAYPVNLTGGFDTDVSGFGGPIDLSAQPYQNLTGTVLFRIYGWNSTSGSSPTYIRNLTGSDFVVCGNVEPLESTSEPSLSIFPTNGMAFISVTFAHIPSTNYVLQRTWNLTDSNLWNTVSGPVVVNTNWLFEATNSAFYRIVPE